MFIGGGSAGTAGGIKVTTFALLAFVMLAEVRGEPTVHVLGRRLPAAIQRQALTVALAGIGLVMTSTVILLAITPIGLDAVLFETVSAFATVGLSTGITDDLPPAGQLVLTALMFLGRLGPITLPARGAGPVSSSRSGFIRSRPAHRSRSVPTFSQLSTGFLLTIPPRPGQRGCQVKGAIGDRRHIAVIRRAGSRWRRRATSAMLSASFSMEVADE
jgi:hypothetical protein